MSDNNEENEEMIENEEEEIEEENENNENDKEKAQSKENKENENNSNNEEQENEEVEEEEEKNNENNKKEEETKNNEKNNENKPKKKANIIVKNNELQKKIKALEKEKKKEQKKETIVDEKIEKIKEINNKKFQNISPQYLNTQNTAAINTFLIPETKELHSNPEFIKDFNQAKDEILNKLSENEKNEEIMKILFPSGFEKKPSKKTLISSERISEKVSDALAKKKDEIERIKKQYDNDYHSKHTFSPKINTNDDKPKRKLNEFLEDQKSHQQQVKDKITNLKIKKDEEIKKNISNKPKINKNTDELVKKKNKGENLAPVHMRLYNLKDEKQKKIIEEKEKKEKEFKENREHKKKNFLPKYLKNINKDDNNNKKEKKEIKKNFFKKKFLLEKKDLHTNKLILNNFDEKFNEILSNFFEEENENENENEENKNKKNEEHQNYDNKTISQSQLEELLFKMGMTTISPSTKETKKEEEEEQQQKLSSNEGLIKQEEKRLLSEIYENLKENDNNVKISNLKKFLYCIIGLYNYILFKEFSNANPNEFKNFVNNVNNNNENDDNYDEIIIKQNEEIENNIDKNNNNNNKYISYDQNNNKIYSLKNSKNIKKDFNLFSINFSQNRIKKNPTNINNEKNLFVPNINKNSEQMSQKFREKIFNNNPDIIDSNSNPVKNSENNEKMNYINKILMQRKKKLAENEKIREENIKKEMEQCTFKPKINNVASVVLKPRGANRIEELYHKGSEKEKNRKNKTSDEVDFDKNQKDYTFHPNIYNNPVDNNNNNIKNDIHGERSYRLYYERIRNGRMEQMVKDAINDRYGLDEVLKDFIKKNKKEIEDENADNDNNNNLYDEMNIETSERENANNGGKAGENDDEEIDKKEGIPQLIIDVNIRQGVKKKIYVYEGDTPEGLAEKFAKEHNLEPETKEKLQNLIRNHMLRLLTKIDEENQSLSEK